MKAYMSMLENVFVNAVVRCHAAASINGSEICSACMISINQSVGQSQAYFRHKLPIESSRY